MSKKTRGKTNSGVSASQSPKGGAETLVSSDRLPQGLPRSQAVASEAAGGENRIVRLEGAAGASVSGQATPDACEETEALLAATTGLDEDDLAKDLERLSEASSM